jgi:vesicular inhibitory amino acid transporter
VTNSNPWWPSEGTFLQVYGRTSSIVFAFQGQSIYYEIMREMKDSRDFGKAVTIANSMMGSVYLVTCLIVTYFSYTFMHEVPEFLPNSISVHETLTRTVVGLLLSYHVTISYILNNQPLSNAIHAMVSPDSLLDYDTYHGRMIWFCITTTLLIFSVLVANTIPYFSTFQSLVGSLMGAPLMFGWPAFFYWRASWNQDGAMHRLDVVLCLVFLFIFLPLCTILGTISAVQDLLNDWSTSGLPFQCV